MKTSKVLTVKDFPDPVTGNQKTFPGKNGMLYSFYVTMENQDAGEYQAKTPQQDYFVVGKETEYEFDTTYPNYPKIKRAQKEFTQGGSKPGNNRSFALSYAKDVWVAKVNKESPGDKFFTSNQCIQLADKFVEWLDQKPNPGSIVIQDKPATFPISESNIIETTDDLPF